jgi:predicted RNA-binding Zn-ribbon protein involved in translation (DUF1610 family)
MSKPEESDADLLHRLGTDAQKWARALLERCQLLDQVDAEGFLIGWFANAIEAGRSARVAANLRAQLPAAIPMLLTCPSCGDRHIDEAEFADKPHHTHACQGCGMVWRPAKVATVGVQFLPGYKNPEPA